ncbi:MAG: hypothetical protein IBX53_15900 [Halomonas sp.]|uniref:SOS response-associated peptidase family protein n=1 Tax=Halomonas sp. TaxID=1486246 RepID=UPI001A0592AB|nr:SOS response-associated peptidase family protein [Halomonas sp.]MBE0490549.1 hypothetical protein [Halomonas sp.]
MCGRYALYSDFPSLAASLKLPLILNQQSLETWLDPDLTGRETIRHLVHHLPHDRLTHWPVSPRVNRPVEDDPGLIEALS